MVNHMVRRHNVREHGRKTTSGKTRVKQHVRGTDDPRERIAKPMRRYDPNNETKLLDYANLEYDESIAAGFSHERALERALDLINEEANQNLLLPEAQERVEKRFIEGLERDE